MIYNTKEEPANLKQQIKSADMCQVNLKSIVRLGMNSQSHSTSHLKMTKQPRNF
jgi:hypothetical protein